jgi:hypothetical protein
MSAHRSDRHGHGAEKDVPQTWRKRPVEIEAMLIVASNDNRNPDGSESFLDPNRRSIAAVSGWLLGNGFRGFRVDGDGPFGIATSFSIDELELVASALNIGVDAILGLGEYADRPIGPCALGEPVRHQGLEPRTRWLTALPDSWRVSA